MHFATRLGFLHLFVRFRIDEFFVLHQLLVGARFAFG